jgi:hypothetical protein
MPEVLSKHPDITLEVLRSAGAQCGAGAPQQILKACPAERFCKLPGGEICVYGVPEAGRMTQMNAADWRSVQFSVGGGDPGGGAGMALWVAGALLLCLLARRWRPSSS